MKKYQAMVCMSYYVWVDVEADSEDSARDQALRKGWRSQANGDGNWGEEPEVLELNFNGWVTPAEGGSE
jgi:hypothetical protein